MELPLTVFRRTPEELYDQLCPSGRRSLRMVLTRNRRSMLSVSLRTDPVALRLHEDFLSAPEEVVCALRSYLRTGSRKAWIEVADYARKLPLTPPPPLRLPPSRDRHHPLQSIAREVNRRHFAGRVHCQVVWGRAAGASKQNRNSIRFGSYDGEAGLIRIHPDLDDPSVPRAFVAYIVYHEMLHDVVPARIHNGRTYHHSPTFTRLEKSYPDYEAMAAFARAFLSRRQRRAQASARPR